MEFSVESQCLKCPNCETKVEIKNNPEDVVEHDLNLHEMKTLKIEEKTSTSMECEGCGAIVEVDATSTSTSCPYCGSHYVLSQKQIEYIIPDGVIPFKVGKREVESIFSQWIKKRWFAPNVLKTLYQQDKVQGIYMPYWTFDANTSSTYTAMGGINYEEEYEDSEGNTHTRIKTRWYPTSGYVSRFFDDVLVRASKKLDKSLLSHIEPYNTKYVASYSPDYMSGYSSEIHTVDIKDAYYEARSSMNNTIHHMAECDVLTRYDRVSSVVVKTSYTDETYKHIFIPVYSTSYVYKDKHYNVLINGETGKINGQYPKSIAKITALIVVILAIVFGIYTASQQDEAYSYDNSEIQYSKLVEDKDFIINKF